MLEAGIVTNDSIIDDGKLHRFHVQGDKRSTKNGAYILHNDNKPAGWFQHFNAGITGNWTASGKVEPISSAMLEQIERERKQRQLEQQTRHNEIALKAREIWQRATPTQSHNYLTKKHIQPHSARILDNDLIIALWNEKREISTLQFINANGDKRFLAGGKKAGCFAVIGKHDAPHDKILICEGFATGASLRDDTGHFVICAMDANNLENVARVIRRLFNSASIVICGDNDASGVGQKAAKNAAIVCGGAYLMPPIEGMDWNDYLTMADA